MKPILDKAEVSIDLADRYYRSSFERDASFEVRTDEDEMVLKLVYKGDGARVAGLHLHYFLLADILAEMPNRWPPSRRSTRSIANRLSGRPRIY